jgi:hypothetical protein
MDLLFWLSRVTPDLLGTGYSTITPMFYRVAVHAVGQAGIEPATEGL